MFTLASLKLSRKFDPLTTTKLPPLLQQLYAKAVTQLETQTVLLPLSTSIENGYHSTTYSAPYYYTEPSEAVIHLNLNPISSGKLPAISAVFHRPPELPHIYHYNIHNNLWKKNKHYT